MQDGIFRALDINDSHVVSIVADKVLFPDVSEEKILVCLEECNKSGVRFDLIPKPKIVWSGDGKNHLGLRALPKVPRKDQMYYTEDPEKADTKLWVITPETFTFLTPTKIILDTVEAIIGSKGFVYIAIFPGSYSSEQMTALEEFKSLIGEQSKEYSGIRMSETTNLNEWIIGK